MSSRSSGLRVPRTELLVEFGLGGDLPTTGRAGARDAVGVGAVGADTDALFRDVAGDDVGNGWGVGCRDILLTVPKNV